MLTLTIREKNGEERQLRFDKEEVTIGRAGGSDIVLPRNNISKRHARLVDKHDKVVIVDLRSTNGTYVNGRRITAPELLTDDDKVYIGDFVIRLAAAAGDPRATAQYGEAVPPFPPVMPEDARRSQAPTVAQVPAIPGQMQAQSAVEEAIDAVPDAGAPPLPGDFADEDEATQAISVEIAAEIDDDEATAAFSAEIAAEIDAQDEKPQTRVEARPVPVPEPQPPVKKTRRLAPPDPPEAKPEKKAERKAPKAPEPPPPELAPGPQPDEEDQDGWQEWNATVALIVNTIDQAQVASQLDWEKAERLAEAVVDKAVKGGRVSGDIETEALVQDAVTELVGLGPLADLMADADVEQIVTNGPHLVRVWRGGSAEDGGRTFSSLQSYERVVDRLAEQAGYDLSEILPSVIDATLASDGTALTMVRPPVSANHSLVTIRRPRTGVTSLDDLNSSGSITKQMSKELAAAVTDGKNIVVTGKPGSGRTTVAAALIGQAPAEERVAVIAAGREIDLPQGDVLRIARGLDGDSEGVFQHLAHLGADRVLLDEIDANNVADFVALALSGGRPVVATAREDSPETMLRRLALALELTTAAPLGARATSMLAEAIDVVVCLEGGRGGVPRVNRIVEVSDGDDGGFSLRVLSKRR